MLVLAIESSTSSAKAVLYDTVQGVVRSGQEVYSAGIGHDGQTNAQAVFETTMRVARGIAQGERVEAVALCGTWHGICACDSKMVPITPVYSWNFTRTANMCKQMRKNEELRKKLYHNTGCMPHNTYPRHAIQYMMSRGMDLTNKVFITQGGYNFYRLTGKFWESISTQSGTGVVNLFNHQYDKFTLEFLGIRREQLGRLVTYRNVCPLSENGAKLLGIRQGTPVVPAHPDGALNQIGNYASHPGIMTISIGTSGALRMATETPILPKGNELWCYCGAEGWISGAAISGACNCVNWFRDCLCSPAVLENGHRVSFQELECVEELRGDVPVFLPFLFGERCPGWCDSRRAGFYQVKASHGIREFYQSLQMGILYNLYQCYEVLCRENGRPRQIIVSGGISNSRRWLQMLADIFEEEILVANHPNASSMGAVALALYACGQLDDINEFRQDYDAAEKIEPNQYMFSYYMENYQRYLRMYYSDLN